MNDEREVAPARGTVEQSPTGPRFRIGPLTVPLPRRERSWGAAISRCAPFPDLAIEGGLDGVARPDLALHSLVEAMPVGATIDVTLPNVAFADRVVGLLHGRWTDTAVRRHFTRGTAADLAAECGLTVQHLVDHHFRRMFLHYQKYGDIVVMDKSSLLFFLW